MKKLIFVFLVSTTMLAFSCGNSAKDTANSTDQPKGPESEPAKPDMNVAQVKKLIDERKTMTLLDVRTPGEVLSGKIAGAVNMDINDGNFSTNIGTLDKSKMTVVYCAVGGRSARATQILRDAGFTNVYNMTGGMNAWKAAGYPTVTQ